MENRGKGRRKARAWREVTDSDDMCGAVCERGYGLVTACWVGRVENCSVGSSTTTACDDGVEQSLRKANCIIDNIPDIYDGKVYIYTRTHTITGDR